jgi:hypothetical protein
MTLIARDALIDRVLDTIYGEVANPGYDGRWELAGLAERVVDMVLEAQQPQGAVAGFSDAISLAEHLSAYAPDHERARFAKEIAELRSMRNNPGGSERR